jgi:glycosyltransferase involved in cell wall biosynthesis
MVIENHTPMLSIIIPCLGHAQELAGCLTSLQNQDRSFAYEVLVVDSASDPEVALITKKFSGVRLVRSEKGLLAGAARNLGAQHAQAQTLGFVDADCLLNRGWVEQAVSTLQHGCKIAGGPVLDALPWNPIARADNLLQFADFKAGRPAGPARHFPSCNMVMPRSVFESLEGFREDVATGEDTLLTQLAAQRWPADLHFNPRLVVFHSGRTTWQEFIRHQRSFGGSRARYGLNMSAGYERLASHPALAGLVVLRRFAYLALRTIQWDLAGLPAFVFLSPLILIGLTAWTQGFYQGFSARKVRV